ncbi:MAG: M48 family metalloprotease [Spirochaetaceae bacterium]|jgi:predicted Zn-dependent protease|nr:M48 family metalloprotease [Spirochaetaceae bacterium]
MKHFFYPSLGVCIAVFSFLSLVSCETMAKATDIGAQVAGALGVIDEDTAGAISQSSSAIARAAEEITPEQEYYIGRAVGANLLNNYRAYTQNPALTAYLNKICSAIVINSPKPEIFNGYHVLVLDSSEINAFATSGGHIFITRGLIACANSEDALAAVIAHEIAHIQLQHSIKAIKTSRITQAILITGTSTAKTAGKNLNIKELTDIFDESVGNIVTTLVNNGYSQTQEFEADRLALALLASAGYNPGSLMEMLVSLEQNQPRHPGGFNKTHPAPAQRISNVRQAVDTYRAPDTRSFRLFRYRSVQGTAG